MVYRYEGMEVGGDSSVVLIWEAAWIWGGVNWKRVEGSRYIQQGFHREDGVVLPFKENLKERHEAAGQNKISVYLLFNIKQGCWDGGTSPAHSLHHMCNETVRDARTGLLCQVEGILQFLNGSYSAATCPPLLLQLVVKEKSNRNDLACRAARNFKKREREKKQQLPAV